MTLIEMLRSQSDATFLVDLMALPFDPRDIISPGRSC